MPKFDLDISTVLREHLQIFIRKIDGDGLCAFLVPKLLLLGIISNEEYFLHLFIKYYFKFLGRT